MRSKLNLQEFRIIAEDSCLIAQQAEAEKIFACCDIHGVTSLELLFDTKRIKTSCFG